MRLLFLSIIEKHPSAGYIGAAVPTSAGFWVLIENATKIGALVSIAIGITVGLVTLRVQHMQVRKLEKELKR